MAKAGDQMLVVERKKLSQWFFNITKFSDELLKDIRKIKRMARKSQIDAKKLDWKIFWL